MAICDKAKDPIARPEMQIPDKLNFLASVNLDHKPNDGYDLFGKDNLAEQYGLFSTRNSDSSSPAQRMVQNKAYGIPLGSGDYSNQTSGPAASMTRPYEALLYIRC